MILLEWREPDIYSPAESDIGIFGLNFPNYSSYWFSISNTSRFVYIVLAAVISLPRQKANETTKSTMIE